MIEYVGAGQEDELQSILQLSGLGCREVLSRLDIEDASNFGGIGLSSLVDDVDPDLLHTLLNFCSAMPSSGANLSLRHCDLGSGSQCEQRLFELTAERLVRESEKAHAEKVRRDSSKQKEFPAAAAERRKGQAGIDAATERLTAIDAELAELEEQKVLTPWYVLFNQMKTTKCNPIHQLELSDCGLHATGVALLTSVLLDLEHRFEGKKVSSLSLDGNDLTDIGMGVLSSYVKLSKEIEVLTLRNVGITEQGVSELVAGLVSNRSLRLLDLRSNGLIALDTARAAVAGVQRFNPSVHILLS
jgi:hypothetical protein